MTRRALRQEVFCLLFQHDFYPKEEMAQEIELYLMREEMEKFSESEKVEIRTRARHACAMCSELDQKIEAASEGWSVGRMGKVELTLLRLALYEILYDDAVPEKVAINEAVELAKKFGGDEAPGFVNGVLAKLVPKS